MKLLHTGDWHINARLGNRSRSEEIFTAMGEIADLLETHRVDVMIVAGDLFRDPHMDKRETGEVVGRIKSLFGRFLERGGTIVAITGNHDSEIACRTLRDTLALAPAKPTPLTSILPSGRLYIETEPKRIRLADSEGGIVQFILMPYPNSMYLRGETTHAVGNAARNRAIYEKYQQAVTRLTETPAFDDTLPAVFVSHIHVRGVNANARTAYEVSEAEDVIFEPGDIPTHFTYVAYGHIHDARQKPTANAEHVRYCGSIVALDAGERDDVKSVVVFDITGGKAVNIKEIPLSAPKFIHEITLNAETRDHERLAELFPHIAPDRDLVKYNVVYTPGVHNLADIERAVQDTFPGWYARKLAPSQEAITISTPLPPRRNVEANIREYITAHYDAGITNEKNEVKRLAAEAERDALLELAMELWHECSAEAVVCGVETAIGETAREVAQ